MFKTKIKGESCHHALKPVSLGCNYSRIFAEIVAIYLFLHYETFIWSYYTYSYLFEYYMDILNLSNTLLYFLLLFILKPRK